MGKFTPRDYQQDCIDKAFDYYKNSPKENNGIIIVPTGGGKSLIIAEIIKKIGVKTLILQPSQEILTQNYEKYVSDGNYATIYCASLGYKHISSVVFATIGSVINILHKFKDFGLILIDECHLVNPEDGQYLKLINKLQIKTIGLTASPYRLYSTAMGNMLKFLTRIQGSPIKDIIHCVQNKTLFERGYLAKLNYYQTYKHKKYDTKLLQLNQKGTDYTDESVKRYNEMINFSDSIKDYIVRLLNYGRKNILVFVRFLEDARKVAELPGVVVISGELDNETRRNILSGFKSGKIKVVVNVGVLTTGFDYPELETILIARATMSLSLYYQIVGRGIRIHPNKKESFIVDMCENFERFGKVEDLEIGYEVRQNKYGMKYVSKLPCVYGVVKGQRKQLTNVFF